MKKSINIGGKNIKRSRSNIRKWREREREREIMCRHHLKERERERVATTDSRERMPTTG